MTISRQYAAASPVKSDWVLLHSGRSQQERPDWQVRGQWLSRVSVARGQAAYRSTKTDHARQPM